MLGIHLPVCFPQIAFAHPRRSIRSSQSSKFNNDLASLHKRANSMSNRKQSIAPCATRASLNMRPVARSEHQSRFSHVNSVATSIEQMSGVSVPPSLGLAVLEPGVTTGCAALLEPGVTTGCAAVLEPGVTTGCAALLEPGDEALCLDRKRSMIRLSKS